jgi:ATP-dependent helicase/nuclease subunit A
LPIPAWAANLAPQEALGRQKLRPSTAGDSAAAHSGSTIAPGHAALRGEFIHRLLEILPGTPRAAWDAAARHLLQREAAALPAAIVDAAIARAAAILEDSRFRELFGPDSRPEVPIQAWLDMPGGPPFEMNGRIDRLVVNDHSVVIVDFKTGAVPHNPADTPRLYLIQLAAYRTALRRIFRGKTLRAAILWTEAPLLVEIPAADLDAAEMRLVETAVSPGPPPLDDGR